MRLAAVYIPKNKIPFLFGEDHKGQTINFGVRWRFTANEGINKLIVSHTEISNSIKSEFWGEGISSISAIVGRNGIGKTTILRAINHQGDSKRLDVVYFFEHDNKILIHNQTGLIINTDFEYKLLEKPDYDAVKLYFSPITDSKLIETKSPLNIVDRKTRDLNYIFLKQFHLNVIFQNDPVFKTILKVYPDFPRYNNVRISIPQVRKFDIKNIYGTANLGNEDRTAVARTYIKGDLDDLLEGKFDDNLRERPNSFVKDILNNYISIIESSSLNSLFNVLWKLPEYEMSNDQDYIHDQNDFIRNFEVLIFTYLILDATFPQTPFQGQYDPKLLFVEDAFRDRLNNFLHLYFSQVYGDVVDGLIEKEIEIKIENYENIKEFINQKQFSRWKTRGFESSKAVEALNLYLERFKAIHELYDLLQSIIESRQMSINGGSLNFNVSKVDSSVFSSFIRQYEHTLSTFESVVTDVTLLSFDSEQVLSSGENALISFYSRLSNYINIRRSRKHLCYDYYLLLLDEPELGYHPYWKKKFVDAITKTLPVLFRKIKPSKSVIDGSDVKSIDKPEIQVVFSTHDPLTLSDMPNSNVVYLDRDIDSKKTVIIDNYKEPRETFGANITDLLADSFFLDEGLVGEFAQSKINKVITWLNSNDEADNSVYYRNLIEIIDEPILKIKLLEMYSEKTGISMKNKILNEQIRYLESLKDD